VTANNHVISLESDENVLELGSGDVHITLNILKTTGLYTPEGQILCHVNCIPIKLFLLRKRG
jgi:phospholipid N-methyltransferase